MACTSADTAGNKKNENFLCNRKREKKWEMRCHTEVPIAQANEREVKKKREWVRVEKAHENGSIKETKEPTNTRIDYVVMKLRRLMFQPLLISSHQTDLYYEWAYSGQPHRNVPLCGHIFFRSPLSLYYPFPIQCFLPRSLSFSLSLFPPLSHSHFHTLIHTYSFAFFLIGHCLYSSLFSLLKIAFIRNIDSHKTKRECLTFDKCSVHWWQFVLFFLTISSFSFMCYLFFCCTQ